LSQPKEIHTTGNHFSSFGHTWFHKKIHVFNQYRGKSFFIIWSSPSELVRLKQFIEDSKKRLYPDCQKYSRLSGDLKLLQLKTDHGWSNKSFKHLFDVLRDMLPDGNQIAESIYEAKRIICPLGIEVEKIHACKNSCVLFSGDYVDLDKCPKCGYDRYKRKNDGGDDNNADYENESGEIRGKKKANKGAPVRVLHYSSFEKMVRNMKGGPTLALE
jgi:hypothetical protein